MTATALLRELHRRDRALALGGWIMVTGFLLDRTRALAASARTRIVSGLALVWFVAFAGMLALALAGQPLPAGL